METVDFWWAGEPLGLSLSQPQRSSDGFYEMQWGPKAPLGVSLSVDELSSRVVVVRSTRLGVEVGDVLMAANGLEIRGDNVEDALATLQSLHEASVELVELKFAKKPEPVAVNALDPQSQIARFGVSGDGSFELLSVNDKAVKYLEMDKLHQLLLELPRPCLMRFQRLQLEVQGKMSEAQDQQQRQRSKSQGARAAAAAAGLAIAAAMSVTLS